MTMGMFSSMHLDWRTPKELYDKLDAEFAFESNFVNPPYGREVVKWCRKALDESQKGKLVVMLVASRTDTAWWHDYVMNADEIRFIRGRLKFDGYPASGCAPFPSAIVIFRGRLVQ